MHTNARDRQWTERRAERDACYSRQWGPKRCTQLRPSLLGRPWHVAVYAVRDRAGAAGQCLVSNGMSEHVQRAGDGHLARTELWLGVLGGRRRWPIRLLDALVRYPFVNETYVASYDVVPVAALPRPARPPCSHLLMVPTATPTAASDILLLQAVAIDQEECEFGLDRGGAALAARLSEIPEALWVDGERGRVV